MSTEDERYATLKGQYNAVVSERDALNHKIEGTARHIAYLESEVARLSKPTETMALLCDGECGRAIAGQTEADIRAFAEKQGWIHAKITTDTTEQTMDHCPACHKVSSSGSPT